MGIVTGIFRQIFISLIYCRVEIIIGRRKGELSWNRYR